MLEKLFAKLKKPKEITEHTVTNFNTQTIKIKSNAENLHDALCISHERKKKLHKTAEHIRVDTHKKSDLIAAILARDDMLCEEKAYLISVYAGNNMRGEWG